MTQPASLPHDEVQRLKELASFQVVDTVPEVAFDDLTSLASQICGTPIALVSLIDEHRQWFKSKVGVTVSETERDIAFCAHCILQNDLMVVPDALSDSRFAQNPLVTNEPKIRFYAGAPLTTSDGHNLGTLCVIDRVPREMTEEKKKALLALSRQVMAQLELRRQLLERNSLMNKLQCALKEVKILKGTLPVCSVCKTIRNEEGEWIQIETYIRDNSHANFTHTYCPSCKQAVLTRLSTLS